MGTVQIASRFSRRPFRPSDRSSQERWKSRAARSGPLHAVDTWHGGINMLIALAIILGIAWLLGFTVFKVTSVAIHLLIILAVVSLVGHLLRPHGGGLRT